MLNKKKNDNNFEKKKNLSKKKFLSQKNNFTKKDRISKRLAMLGIASRREAEKLVTDGNVKINNIVCKDLSFLVSYDDEIAVNGKNIVNKPIRTKVYLMNKPSGYVTTNNDPQGRRTIFELIPSKLGRLITVGRLDFNTEGLLLLTNNGELARIMEMPATSIKRTYFANVIGDINDRIKDRLLNLKNGIKIEGTEYGKMIVEIESASQTKATLRIVIFEGKNNEIRRIMWHLGLKVVKLVRVQYGDFCLHGLPSGCVRESRLHVDLRDLERRASRNIKKYNLSKEKNKKQENNKEGNKKHNLDEELKANEKQENDKKQEDIFKQENQKGDSTVINNNIEQEKNDLEKQQKLEKCEK